MGWVGSLLKNQRGKADITMTKTILNLGILTSSWLLVLCGCDRKLQDRTNVDARNTEHRSSHQTEHNSPEKSTIVASGESSRSNSESDQLADEQKQIFSSIPAGSMLSAEALARLSALVPRLKASGRFWDAIGAVPPDQLSHFRDVILSELRNLDHQNGSYVNPEFRNAYRVSRWLRDPEVAVIAFGQLQREKPFVYPQESPVKGWPTAEHTDCFEETKEFSPLPWSSWLMSKRCGLIARCWHRLQMIRSAF